MEEANKINGETPTEQKREQPKTNEGIDIFALAKQNNQAASGFDTVTIRGFGTFNVPQKYLKGNANYQDANTGKYAVANGLSSDRKTLKFDRSNSPCLVVLTNEGHEVSIKIDTLSANLQRHAVKMPEGL